jgi:hypothetical protein
MITAKELFDKMILEDPTSTSTEMMIEFAKLHVNEALEIASESAEVDIEYENPVNPSFGHFHVVDKGSIFDAYPLTNIK